jgi:hypothetical protein
MDARNLRYITKLKEKTLTHNPNGEAFNFNFKKSIHVKTNMMLGKSNMTSSLNFF